MKDPYKEFKKFLLTENQGGEYHIQFSPEIEAEIEAKREENDYPIMIKDSNNNEIYYESSNGYWIKYEYDSNNNIIYYENSEGDWYKQEFDSNNNKIYYEDNDGYWSKREYDSNNNVIYWENSDGTIRDNRPK